MLMADAGLDDLDLITDGSVYGAFSSMLSGPPYMVKHSAGNFLLFQAWSSASLWSFDVSKLTSATLSLPKQCTP